MPDDDFVELVLLVTIVVGGFIAAIGGLIAGAEGYKYLAEHHGEFAASLAVMGVGLFMVISALAVAARSDLS